MHGEKISRRLLKAMWWRGTVSKSRFLRTPLYSVQMLTAERSAMKYLQLKTKNKLQRVFSKSQYNFATKLFYILALLKSDTKAILKLSC